MSLASAKALGTKAETFVARYLKDRFWPLAERKRLTGRFDKGDITGTPRLTWEIKAGKTADYPGWLRETETERANASSEFGILVHKPTGVGFGDIGLWLALMDMESFERLVKQAEANGGGQIFQASRKVRATTPLKALMFTALEAKELLPAVRFETNQNLPDYYVMYLRDMTTLLHEAGYGDKREGNDHDSNAVGTAS